ncbi:MAG TPA: hypothetical protein VF103_13090 [Polyangiaceae bacterium]
MSDLLDEATRALREEGKGDDAAHRFTRARVMASLHQGTVKRRTRLALLLPIAATFVATSAWGVSSGRARVWIDEIKTTLGFEKKAEEATPAPKPTERKPLVRREAKPPQPTEPAAPEAPEPIPPEVAEPPAAAAPAVPLPSASASERLDAELELYRAAHRSHFTERNPAAALSAWDAYLAKAPSGRFALEARYNRALCLVRLDRKAEARAALEPFARGAFGAYRKREAGELLEALDR